MPYRHPLSMKRLLRRICLRHEVFSVRPPPPSFRMVSVMSEGVLPYRNPSEPGLLVLPATGNGATSRVSFTGSNRTRTARQSTPPTGQARSALGDARRCSVQM